MLARLLPAILLSAGLQSTFAATTAVPVHAHDTVVQAQLVVQADPAGPTGRRGPAPAHPAAKLADPSHDEPRSPAAMLFAALALMTGIALRRWGMGQQ